LVLLPSASEYLPEAVEPLLQRRGALLGFLEPAAQESVANSVNSFNTAKRNLPDEGDPLKQAGETKDPERRDQLYFLAAQRAVKAGDFENAFAHTEKMSSRNSRPAHEQIIFQIAQQELQAGNVEDARRRIAAEADLAWRAYLLTRMGVFYLEGKAKDVQRAEEVLNEVATLAGKLDTGVEKALVLAGAAAVYARFDQVRALEVFREFVTAANKAEKFDGRNFLMRSLPLNKFYYGSYLYQDFTFTEIFTRLARGYFDTLLVEARTLNHPMARAKAIITLCDAVL
jgi:hypothetical protein